MLLVGGYDLKKREAVDERRVYTKEEKEYILSKTGGRCAHCGKKLSIKTMQKDHSIPWSKGGVSDVENIVPLCAECNKKKSDRVLSPDKYFKYLKKGYLEPLQKYFETYLKDVEYLNMNTLFPLDEYIWKVDVPMVIGGKLSNKSMKVVFRKAVYYELDEIYSFLLDYHNYYDLFSSEEVEDVKERLKEELTGYFLYGCIVYSRMSSGEIATVVLTTLDTEPIVTASGDIIYAEGTDTVLWTMNFQFHMFLNPKISFDKIPIIEKKDTPVPPSYDVTRFIYYSSSLDALCGMLICDLQGFWNSTFPLLVSVSKSDPRGEKLLRGFWSRSLPCYDDELDLRSGGNTLFYYIVFANKNNFSEEYIKLEETDPKLARIIEYLNGQECIYNKIRDNSLFLKSLKTRGYKGMLLSEYVEQNEMSLEESIKFIKTNGA